MDNAEFLLGTVTGVSSANGIQIQLDGQEEAMSKHYKMMITGANVPVVGDRVVVMKHSGTYVVMGKIGTPSQNIGKVNRTGDTMTGSLTIRDACLNIDDPDVTVGTRPETNQWSKPLRIRDSAGKSIARIIGFYGADGTCGLQLYGDQIINGESKYNFISLNIGENGVASVNMNHPEAWRKALGLGTDGSFPLTIAQGGSGNTGVVSESTIANIATAGTNITLTSAYYYQWGKLAMIQVNGTCNEAVATGSTLFTLVSGKRPKTNSSAQVWQSTTNTTVIYADGKAVLGGNSSFSATTGFTVLATYLLA